MAANVARPKTSTFSLQMGEPSGSDHHSSGRPPISRPSDGLHQQSHPHGSPLFSRAKSGMVSYEDLLVAQYLEGLRQQKSEMHPNKEQQQSPYLQRLPHANLIPGRTRRQNHRQRPFSASMALRSRREYKPKIDAKFIADMSLWDPATPREKEEYSPKHRPASAPIKNARPLSGISTGSIRRRSRPGSAYKSTYKQQPRTISVVAFKNGSRDVFVNAAASTLKILLEFVTEKLGLGFAARRIFLEDGVEVFDAADIPPHAEVYVSCGENYKDPFDATKKNVIVRQGAKWSLQGIILPEESKKQAKHRLSKRLRSLAQNNKMRILIYQNGSSAEGSEVVVEPDKFDEFLQACTGRLALRTYARKAYDLEGNEVTNLEDTPVLDDCLKENGLGGQLQGPLWISTGEQFSPLGTHEFLLSIKQLIKQKLKDAKHLKSEVDRALNDGHMDNITLPSVKNMSSDQLYFALEEADTKVTRLKNTLKLLNEKLDKLKDQAQEEEAMGPEYRLQHIQEVSADDRLLGKKGLRLKVFENGLDEGEFIFYFNLREGVRGLGGAEYNKKLLQRLLDELSYTVRANKGPQTRLAAVAQKLFNRSGKEITDVSTLKNDDEIWVSYGEPFIALSIVYSRVKMVTSLEGAKFILRDATIDPDILDKLKDHSLWETSTGLPVEYSADSQPSPSQEELDMMKENGELDQGATYLLFKDRLDVCMYPELAMDAKPKRGQPDTHVWLLSKAGCIYNKGMPQLCLGVTDTRMEGRLFTRDAPVEGFVVTVQKKMPSNNRQIWKFSADGGISPEAYPELLLTFLGNRYGDDESYNNNRPQGLVGGARVYLVVADPLSKKDAACQRFALKQERFDNLGQWKYSDVQNPEWGKQALSWPVKRNRNLNEEFDWPMEGFFQAFAPPVSKKIAGETMLPARLRVIKNGDDGSSDAVTVVGPSLATMMKENRERKPQKKKKKKKHAKKNTEDTVDDLNIHCMDFSVEKFEFTMFLDSCTMLLHLPSSARRLFDEHGQEHFTLHTLQRDQLVFVSCGEGWCDPRLTREEQQKRAQLTQLSSDVGRIRQYCALRNPTGFVLEVQGNLNVGSRIILGSQWKPDEELPVQRPDSSLQQSTDLEQEELDVTNLTAHQRAHLMSEERQNSLRWPWERVVNVTTSVDASDMEAQKYSDPELYKKFKPKPLPAAPQDTLQRFVYEDSYIMMAANRSLVLAASLQEGKNSEVVLAKRAPDDISQRWAIVESEIRCRYNQKLVMTLSFPTTTEGGVETKASPLKDCPITLQKRRLNQFGHAHQRWQYDAETGLIFAFHADLHDKEITAANMSDVCTYAVTGPVEIDQPGYRVEISKRRDTVKQVNVCLSCARAMRGRYRLEALPPSIPFVCAMSEAKKHKLPLIGSFRMLNGKVDLSTHEALITLEKWESILHDLRKETTLSITNEINAARTVTTVKVLTYKNGEGRMREGEIICGSSVEGILNQCTARLGLNSSARRLYAEDGTILLDIDDIIAHAVNMYRSAMAEQLEILMEKSRVSRDNREEEERSKDKVQSASRLKGGMMSQVELFGEEESEREETTGDDENEERRETAETVGKDEPGGELLLREDGGEATDTVEASKIAKHREELLSQVELPPLDTILRYPIEVWVSSGKTFVSPEVVESKEENRRKKRELRSQVCRELDIEKHCLRQIKASPLLLCVGRRYKSQSPGRYLSTLSATQPVIVEGHWQETSVEEQDKHQSVNKLQSHLSEIRANLPKEKSHVVNINLLGSLYKQPNTKRVLVYPNGESPELALMVWGATMTELLDNATIKLGLWRKATCFYNEEGKRVDRIEHIQAEQLLCASAGKPYIRPQSSKLNIEIRANWGRARKQYGPHATDIGVDVKKNPRVEVDPFGPPELALPLMDGKKASKA